MDNEMNIEDRKALENFLLNIEILDQVEAKLANFNAFETLGVIHTEIRHSNVLGWLLSNVRVRCFTAMVEHLVNGNVKQGYFFSVSDDFAQQLYHKFQHL